MGSTLLIANQKNAYTLSDRSTWIAFNKKENLQIVCENLPPLFNQYGIILVSNKINNNLNIEKVYLFYPNNIAALIYKSKEEPAETTKKNDIFNIFMNSRYVGDFIFSYSN